MGYLKIPNLYKDQTILMMKECYALEKIHGTSQHISYKTGCDKLNFFSGGAKHEEFIALFDEASLLEKFKSLGVEKCTIYGEGYGGKMQGMSKVYGPNLKFCAFDVKINEKWLNVPDAEKLVRDFGLEFVSNIIIPTEISEIDAARDLPSVQSERNGIGSEWREGVVLRPLIELTKNNGGRVIAKHKRPDARETKTPREVSQEKLKVLEDAKEIAEEWVTPMRLTHVLDKLNCLATHLMVNIPVIIKSMIEDIELEAKGEIVVSKEARKQIGKKTVNLIKTRLEGKLRNVNDNIK